MPTKTKRPNQDLLEVAAKQKHEPTYIAKTFKIPIADVRLAMKTANKNGKPSKSRKMIYKKLREMGYVIDVSKREKSDKYTRL